MNRLRFTLAQSMALVLLVALGLAGLRSASVLWASAVFTLTMVVLLGAALGALARRGSARIVWAGFALFGWVYLGMAFGPWSAVHGISPPPFVTRFPLDYLNFELSSNGNPPRGDSANVGEELFGQFPLPAIGLPVGFMAEKDSHQFRRIGHCLGAIFFGLLGAAVGRLVAVRDEQASDVGR